MTGISTQSTQYQNAFPLWQQVRDCVVGSAAVKAKTTTYLPTPSLNNNDPMRYQSYIARAVFYNTTSKTLDGLSGAVLRKPSKTEVPELLEYMKVDADGSGSSINQLVKETLDDIIQVGRAGLLVDFPKVSETPITLREERSMNLRASIITYHAESIINWKESKRGAETILAFVVLKEIRDVIDPVDPFSNETEIIYRLLALDEEGFYFQEEWIEPNNTNITTNAAQVGERVYPTYKDGSRLTRIPFIFVGSKNLKPTIDKAPLLDIAVINLAHYRNSADFEEMVFVVGQPTLALTGLTEGWVNNIWKNAPLQVGARSSIQLPVNGDAKFLQVNESQISNLAMLRKEEQMTALGARIITMSKVGVEASETIRLRLGGEASILSNIADNVSEAYTRALVQAALFMGASPENIVYELNDDFFSEKMTPQEAVAIVQLWQQGIIAKSDARDALRKGELLRKDREDERIDQEINDENSNFLSVNLNEG